MKIERSTGKRRPDTAALGIRIRLRRTLRRYMLRIARSMGRVPAERIASLARAAGIGGRIAGRDDALPARVGDRSGPMLRLEDVRKTYSLGPINTEVLRGVELELHRGDMLSIMGASGSGKSTLMNIIGLLEKPTSGTYVIDGRDAWGLSDDMRSALRNLTVGFVFQSFNLLPRLTAEQNVGVPLLYRGVAERDIGMRSRDALARVGMADRAAHRPAELSGGQQQRVAIARALVGEPAIVLADEPTGALDPATAAEIMSLFTHLNAEAGVTTVIITHDPEIGRQCRRRMRLEDGLLHEAAPGTAMPEPRVGVQADV